MNDPFTTTDELVDAHLAWIAAILRDDPLAEPARIVPARVQATRRAGFALPLLLLESRLALSETEMRVLWLLLAHELDPDARRAIRAASTEQVSDVTFDVIRRVVYGPQARSRVWRELEPGAPLRSLGLIQRTDGTGEVPEQRQTFKVARRVLALAHGDLRLDPDLAGIARLVTRLPELGAMELDAHALERARRATARDAGLVIVHGRAGSGRRSLLSACCGRATLVVDGRALAIAREDARRQLCIIAREARLLDAVPLITNLEALGESASSGDRLDLVERELSGLVLATSTHAVRRRLSLHVRFPMPEADERARLWQALLPSTAPTTGRLGLERLAETFVMSGGYIRNAVLRAAFLAADAGSPISDAHLLRAARLEYEGMGKVVPALPHELSMRSSL